MRQIMSLLVAVALVALPASSKENNVQERLKNCGETLKEIMNIPDDIPQDLLDKAECVIVMPSVLKFAIGLGGSYGRGAMSCRTGDHWTGPWGAPTMMVLGGGSAGFQLGGQATDFVLLVMNPRGATSLLKSKVKLGADASAAAGPKGRNAQAATDVTMRAEILSYSRSRGLFAGVSLTGAWLAPDQEANKKIYGREIAPVDIVRKDAGGIPSAAQQMVSILEKHSPKNHSDPKSLE